MLAIIICDRSTVRSFRVPSLPDTLVASGTTGLSGNSNSFGCSSIPSILSETSPHGNGLLDGMLFFLG
jgi:hypothetical protein